ncbi:uncharacterized protein GLRG_07678 [Colletotrichum graminicola M1.001]|uniref:Extracellular membrane protein CFEM domain-containing protein n=1 Tax=Colletotrichum graminicola (strain M1.001 / M2 / FGSC 10212) TaxID=645133 RepID=E3QNQ1_COLGM|nr:uncharacterized protein GLRG_07678 [Colletotrichum graminicola M1.001]EFQ32408.1 hypothetical protein GLRG_07678 [Colletotrichum graminicola M1.001]
MAPARRKTPGFLPLSAPLILLLAAAAPGALAKHQNNFDLYPAAAQPCLYAASDASLCDGDTVASMNQCLCSDARGGFVTSAALCIGRDANPTLRTVYQSMTTACSDSKTPIALTQDQFLALGARGATASSLPVTPSATTRPASSSSAAKPTTFKTTTGGATVTITSTPTSSSTSEPEPESSGLSTAARIGVGVGAVVGVAALLGLAAFVWRLKRITEIERQLPPPAVAAQEYKGEYKQPGGRPVSEIAQATSPVPGSGAQTWATTSPQPPYAQPQQQQQQQHAWGHHPQATYVPPPYQQHQHQQQDPQQGGVFELASIPAALPPQTSQPHPPDAVEMPAAEVQPRPARYIYPSQRQ